MVRDLPARRVAPPVWSAGAFTLIVLLLADYGLRPGGDAVHDVVRVVGPAVIHALAVATVAHRARRDRAHRRAWALLAVGLACFGVGSLLAALHVAAPVSLVLWPAFSLCAYGAVVALLRGRAGRLHVGLWLDGLIVLLVLAALLLTLFGSGTVVDLGAYGRPEALTWLVQLVADAVIVATGLWTLAITGRPGAAMWWRLTGAFGVMAVGHVWMGLQVSAGTYHPATLVNALFPLGTLLIASAARRPALTCRHLPIDRLAVVAAPVASATVAFTVLAAGEVIDVGTPACILALVALATTSARGVVTFRVMLAEQRNRRFTQGFDEAIDGMGILDMDLRWTRVNPALCRMLDRAPEELLGRSVYEVTHPDHMTPELDTYDGAIHADAVWVRADGTSLTVRARIQETEEDGRTLFFGQFRDVTSERRTQRGAAAISDLYRRMLRAGDVEAVGAAAATALRDALPARGIEVLGPDVPGEAHGGRAELPLPGDLGVSGWRLVATWADGHPAITAAEERVLRTAASVVAIALRRALAEDAVRHHATHDPVTGLVNRAFLATQLEQALARGGSGVAVLSITVDRVEQVAESLGHEMADALLRDVGDRLGDVAATGVVARADGTEFAIGLADDGETSVLTLAQAVVQAMRRPFETGGHELDAPASVGVVFAHRGVSAGDLLRDAGIAARRARRAGGDRYELFDARLRERVARRLSVEAELRRAVDREELELHYQPIVDLADGGLAAFEALVRWRHPQRGLLGPDQFIDVAERTGLVRPMGAWIIEHACHQAARWRDLAPAVRLSANLSPRQITPDLQATIVAALRAAQLPPELLTLEITESLLMAGDEPAEVLDALRSTGARVALDDFGTGYSSLGYVRQFPFDVLKLDRAFVSGVEGSARSAAIVRAVIDMAAALGVPVVAEGIELAEQAKLLQRLGCALGQGYLFSRPLPADEATELILRPDREWAALLADDACAARDGAQLSSSGTGGA